MRDQEGRNTCIIFDRRAPGDGSLTIPIIRKVLIENAKLTYRDVSVGVTETIVLKKVSLDGED